MTVDPATLISGLSGLAKIATDLFSANEATKRQALFNEFQKALGKSYADTLAHQQSSLALLDENRDLKQQVVDFKKWEAESQRYRLVNPGASGVVYALRESDRCVDPPHYICANCYQDGKKSHLSARSSNVHGFQLVCNTCKAEISLNARGAPEFKYAPE